MAIGIASWFNPKAKLWISGRKNWRAALASQADLKGCIWFHCASLGEFEQGRPLIEAVKKAHPNQKILLTFYSPSGYEIRKNYGGADHVCYMPLDTPSNAKDFLSLVQPKVAFFVKYEIWHAFFKQLHKGKIPTYLVSAIFRPSQIYFKPWGKWARKSLQNTTHIFTQDAESAKLLSGIEISQVSIAGDTRFDRVLEIAGQSKSDEKLAQFSQGHFTIVGGSTWPEDEALLFKLAESHPDIRLIIAPHETDKKRIESICAKAKNIAIWTDSSSIKPDSHILVIDTIGLLSAAYKYGNVAWIGGGFGKGIHNTLEAAVYGIPVLFGPNFQKFKEARELISNGGAHEITNQNKLEALINSYIQNPGSLNKDGEIAGTYVRKNAGATQTILNQIDIR
jgi:3-deoxy-D-manno-octulosonic-acid transferase